MSRIRTIALGVFGLLAAAAVTQAKVPYDFSTGQTLKADALNGNFDALDKRLLALEAPQPSEILVSTVDASEKAFGSVNTAIFRYTNVEKSVGTAITRSSSATLGDAFTINEAGVYAMTIQSTSYSSGAAGNCGGQVGVSVNAMGAELAKQILDVPYPRKAVAHVVSGACNTRQYPTASVTLHLAVGDVVRPHAAPGPTGSVEVGDGHSSFRIAKVSN